MKRSSDSAKQTDPGIARVAQDAANGITFMIVIDAKALREVTVVARALIKAVRTRIRRLRTISVRLQKLCQGCELDMICTSNVRLAHVHSPLRTRCIILAPAFPSAMHTSLSPG